MNACHHHVKTEAHVSIWRIAMPATAQMVTSDQHFVLQSAHQVIKIIKKKFLLKLIKKKIFLNK